MISLDYVKSRLLPTAIQNEKEGLLKLSNDDGNKERRINYLKNQVHNIGSYLLVIDGDKKLMKHYLSTSSMVFDYVSKKQNFGNISAAELYYLSLCDNVKVLKRLYKAKKIEYYLDTGGGLGWMNAYYQIMEGDWEALKETMVYLKNIRGEYTAFFEPELYFTLMEGFIHKDKDIIESVLDEFEMGIVREKRLQTVYEEKYVSIQTLALAKQAWKHGLPVWANNDGEIVHRYHKGVPYDLLPFQPLSEYTVPYKFLHEFYKEEGVNWLYDPIYPEIQGED